MISIDIGKINQGFAIMNNKLEIGLLNITESSIKTTSTILKEQFDKEISEKDIRKKQKKSSIVLHRGLVLKIFINLVFKLFNIKQVIIERQSQNNPAAQEIEYMITGLCLNMTENVIIYNPINKFSHMNITYDTKNKAHKRLSVNIISKILEYDECNEFYKGLEKKDDVADSIFMLYDIYDRDTLKDFVSLYINDFSK